MDVWFISLWEESELLATQEDEEEEEEGASLLHPVVDWEESELPSPLVGKLDLQPRKNKIKTFH